MLNSVFTETQDSDYIITMRHLILTLCMSLAVVLLPATASIALPACPTDQTKHYHNCEGIFVWSNGDQYAGEFQNNKPQGKGTGIFASGDKYVGDFKNGKYDGQGAYYFLADNKNRGDKHVGEYKDGKKHGQGTYTFANGRRDVGEFKNGILNGYAIQYRSDGSIIREGIFKDDKFLYAAKNSNNSGSSNIASGGFSKVEKSKSTCTEIGFTPGTEEFGKCVLKMMDVE